MLSRERAPRRQRGELRRAVFDAASELLVEHGYAGLTTEAIAHRARVSKGTLYRRWGSKLELVVDLLDERLELIEVPDLGSFETELRAALERRLPAWQQPSTAAIFINALGAGAVDRGLGEAIRERATRQLGFYEEMVRRGIERGDVTPAVDPRSVAALIVGPSVAQLVLVGGIIDRAFVEQLIALVLAATQTSVRAPGVARDHAHSEAGTNRPA
jgi:AcrR family transcriptional regulator